MLTAKQKHHLRALAHHLKPVVQVGQQALSEAVVAKVSAELEVHELIKVKVSKEAPIAVADAAVALGAGSRAEVAQVIGRTVVLYRARAKKPTIRLPAADLADVPEILDDSE